MIEIIVQAILIFLAAAASDIVWALYIKAVGRHQKVKMANYGTLIGLFGLIFIQILVHNIWLGIFQLAGFWVGTYFHQEAEDFIFSNSKKLKNKWNSGGTN